MRPTQRIFKAYWVTLVVLSSYLWIKFLSRYRTERVIQTKMNKAHSRNARRIYRAILELQGLFIKVGQLFSIMTNFLPEAFRHELQSLQDKVPPREYSAMEKRFRDEFGGKGPKDIFEEFDEIPIASASIGQVHRARMPGGLEVAVKVQYPDTEIVVQSDLVALRRIFRLLHIFIPYQGMDAIYDEISEIILQELDFTQEAKSIETISNNFEDRTDVKFPRVIRELTTRRVLTLEYIDGTKVNDTITLRRQNIDAGKVARLVIEAYCQQIFHHGIYHADPHPGNILVTEGPTIHFLDFGAVAEVSEQMRHGLINLLQGAIKGDTAKIVNAFKEMGFLAYRSDPQVYDRVVEYFHERFQQEIKLESFNLSDLKFEPEKMLENLGDLRRMDISLADITDTFHVPKEWIMLERTILLLTGLCTELDPELNPMDVIRPHVERFVLGEEGDWSRLVLDTTRDIALSMLSLPADIRKFVNRSLKGEMEFRLKGYVNNGPLFYALGHQLIYTALGITASVGAIGFYDKGLEKGTTVCLLVASAFGLLLLRSMWFARRLLRRRLLRHRAERRK
ncbi:MAG: AarF/UbiB family protein [Pseudomonadota bacterium]